MARISISSVWQSAYEMGCLLRVCSEAALRDLPDQAGLLRVCAGKLGPSLPQTGEGMRFGKAVEPHLFNIGKPETLAALWALLLSDALQDGIALDLLDPDLAQLLELTRCLGPARRSAILRAADICLKQRQKADTLTLTRGNRFSLPPDRVIARLADLARTASEADIRAIAVADLGAFQIETDEALRVLLEDPECRMPEKDRWHPAEGLSLTSHSHGNPGFLVATVLLLIDGIHHDSAFDYSDYRWFRSPRAYQDLPAPWREPVLRGFRHIMEYLSPYDWVTLGTVDLSKDARTDSRDTGLVPWFDDADTA